MDLSVSLESEVYFCFICCEFIAICEKTIKRHAKYCKRTRTRTTGGHTCRKCFCFSSNDVEIYRLHVESCPADELIHGTGPCQSCTTYNASLALKNVDENSCPSRQQLPSKVNTGTPTVVEYLELKQKFLEALRLRPKQAAPIENAPVDLVATWRCKLLELEEKRELGVMFKEITVKENQKTRAGLIAMNNFSFGEFVTEWRGGLNPNGRKQQQCDTSINLPLKIHGLRRRNETNYNLNVCKLTVNSKIVVFFTARRNINGGEELIFNQCDLTEKLRILRALKRNRIGK